MNQDLGSKPNVPITPPGKSPRGPSACSVLRPDSETLVFAPFRGSGRPGIHQPTWSKQLLSRGILAIILLLLLFLFFLLLGILVLLANWAVAAIKDENWVEASIAVALFFPLALGLVFGILSLASQGRWIRFDRRQGLLTVSRRPFGWRREPRVVDSRPLLEVVSIQLLYGGLVTEYVPQSPSDEIAQPVIIEYDWYKFDLTFRDPSTPPMNIASGRDWLWMREAGRELSEFLGVPVEDRLYHGATEASREK